MAVQPMELQFGVDKIMLTGVSSSDAGLTVHGTNFTPYSVILVDGEQVPTEYIDEQTLAAADTRSVLARFCLLHRSPPRIRSGSSVRRRTGPSRRKNRK